MVGTTFLDSMPIGIVYLFTFFLMLLAFEVGLRYGDFRRERSNAAEEPALDAMTGATLGLLAFLLAFMVSMATDRFDTRRQLEVDEASSIHTTYLQAGYLDEPYSSEIRALLVEYVDLRLGFTRASTVFSSIEEIIQRSEEIHQQLWSRAESVVAEHPGQDEIALFLDSLDEIIRIHIQRTNAALSSRLPSAIVIGMYIVATLSMMMLGYHNGYTGKRNIFSTLVLIGIFTIVMMLIVDLDRPEDGFLQVSQEALAELQRQIGTPGS